MQNGKFKYEELQNRIEKFNIVKLESINGEVDSAHVCDPLTALCSAPGEWKEGYGWSFSEFDPCLLFSW